MRNHQIVSVGLSGKNGGCKRDDIVMALLVGLHGVMTLEGASEKTPLALGSMWAGHTERPVRTTDELPELLAQLDVDRPPTPHAQAPPSPIPHAPSPVPENVFDAVFGDTVV